jgi:type IV secretory pathway VirB10-like protein
MEETTTEEEDAQTRFERPVERLFPAILPILPAAARYGTPVQESELLLLQQQQQQESWLSNPSFSESLLPPPPPPPTRITVTTAAGTAVDAVLERETVAEEEEEEDEEDEQLQQQKHKHKKHSSKKKEDRRKKRKERKPTAVADDDDKHIGSLQGHALDRKNAVKIWADRNAAHLPREYYLDSRGDRDNLAFGSLYRQDGYSSIPSRTVGGGRRSRGRGS